MMWHNGIHDGCRARHSWHAGHYAHWVCAGPAMLVEYWLGCNVHRERRIRAMPSCHVASGGVVDAGVQRALAGPADQPSR